MGDAARLSKRHIIAAWIFGISSALITAPVAFIAGVFATDSGTSAAVTVGFLVILSPVLFIVLPVAAQILYVGHKYTAARICSIVSYAFEAAVLIGLAYVIFG